jgi:hypothetical protein
VPPCSPSPAGGAGQRIALGLAVQVGEPGLTDGFNDGVEHRGLLEERNVALLRGCG